MAASLGAMVDDDASFPLLPITSQLTMQRIADMRVGPRDVFVASFPKSGTTWMQQIVFQLVSASVDQDGAAHISSFAPFLEADRTWDGQTGRLAEPAASLHAALGWRGYNTHLLPRMLPQGPCKIIYVVRDPKDVATSMWHHFSHMAAEDGGYTGELSDFVDDWLAGRLAFGSWRSHIKAWMAVAQSDKRVLLCRYEDLVADLPTQVQRISEHLDIQLDAQRFSAVLPRLSFAWMKQHEEQFEPRSVRWVERGSGAFRFLRNGQVGDARNLLTPRMLALIDAATVPTIEQIEQLCARVQTTTAISSSCAV